MTIRFFGCEVVFRKGPPTVAELCAGFDRLERGHGKRRLHAFSVPDYSDFELPSDPKSPPWRHYR